MTFLEKFEDFIKNEDKFNFKSIDLKTDCSYSDVQARYHILVKDNFTSWEIALYVFMSGSVALRFKKNKIKQYWCELNPETGRLSNKSKYCPIFVSKFMEDIRYLNFNNAEKFILSN